MSKFCPSYPLLFGAIPLPLLLRPPLHISPSSCSSLSFMCSKTTTTRANRKTRCFTKMNQKKSFPVCKEELDISTVLSCGQSFRWKPLESDPNSWIGVFAHKLWILSQTDTEVYYEVFSNNKSGSNSSAGKSKKKKTSSDAEADHNDNDDKENRQLLHDYFQLDISLQSLYKEWSVSDERFATLTVQDSYRGIRILDQDCVENVFSFICSSNNNISRISQMVEKLCLFYGEKIATFEGKDYYDFPTVDKLVGDDVERKLREEKFGYRAKFIAKTAEKIVENGGRSWLENLRNVGYDEARKELQTLTGIGRKVADCICLMSLRYHQAIPVDTHIHQIAVRYLPHLSKLKNLTDKAYSEIADHFRSLHGGYAGWAQSVLFASTLKHLQVESGKTEKVSKSKRKNVPEKIGTDRQKTDADFDEISQVKSENNFTKRGRSKRKCV